jgi:hypothetical protein
MRCAGGAVVGLLLLATGPAVAGPCSSDIATVDSEIQEKAKAAISTSTGGKEAAAAREGRSVEARDQAVPITSIPNAPSAGTPEANATEKAEQAGAGGDRVMLAKATLNRARTLDEKGDEHGCREAIAEAKRQLVD